MNNKELLEMLLLRKELQEREDNLCSSSASLTLSLISSVLPIEFEENIKLSIENYDKIASAYREKRTRLQNDIDNLIIRSEENQK